MDDAVKVYFGRVGERKNLCKALRDYLDDDEISNVRVGKTSLGRPILIDYTDLNISISHSANYWICAIIDCKNGEVGVDLQEEKPGRLTEITKRFFHLREQEVVLNQAGEAFDENFFKVWTAKESYVKYLGTGIDESFSEKCVVSQDFHNDTWQAEDVNFTRVAFRPRFHLCVCTKDIMKIELMEEIIC